MNYSDEEMELFGIADRAKKSKELFEQIKKLTTRYNPEKAKEDEIELARDIAADMEVSNKKDYHGEHRKLFKSYL